MAAVPITYNCVIYPKDKSVEPYAATLVGCAWLSDVGVGGGPIVPPDLPADMIPHPEHPIVLPPTDSSPPELPDDPGMVKPPPPGGGWGWSPVYGWGYFPKPGEASPKK